jgi:hypothetical protein
MQTLIMTNKINNVILTKQDNQINKIKIVLFMVSGLWSNKIVLVCLSFVYVLFNVLYN